MRWNGFICSGTQLHAVHMKWCGRAKWRRLALMAGLAYVKAYAQTFRQGITRYQLSSSRYVLVAALQEEVSTAGRIFGDIATAVKLELSEIFLLGTEQDLELRLEA